VALTETWLTDNIFNNEILHTCFTIYHKDLGSSGGGMMLAIGDCLPSKLLSSPNNLEIIIVSVHPIVFCVIYLPPNSSSEYIILKNYFQLHHLLSF